MGGVITNTVQDRGRCTLPRQCRPPSPRRRWRCDRSSYKRSLFSRIRVRLAHCLTGPEIAAPLPVTVSGLFMWDRTTPGWVACIRFSGKQKGKQRVPSTLRFRKFPGKTEGVWCSLLETREFPCFRAHPVRSSRAHGERMVSRCVCQPEHIPRTDIAQALSPWRHVTSSDACPGRMAGAG